MSKIHHNGESVDGAFRMRSWDGRLALRSESAREIISWQPGFLSKWALFILLIILVLLLLASWLIHYPDMVQAGASLTAANAPKELVIRQEGKLIRIFAASDEPVAAGQTIAWIEGTASHEEVIALSDLLVKAGDYLAADETKKVSGLFVTEFRHLGELQSAYQQFIAAWQQFNDYLVNGYYYKRRQVLETDIAYLRKMHVSLAEQLVLDQQDVALMGEAMQANDSLYRDKVISKQDLRDQKSRLIGKQMNVPQLESSILSNENQQLDKQRDVDELEHSISQQKIIFQQALRTLKSQVDDWELKYMLKAPVAGKVTFIVPLQENQFVQTGKIVGFVNPSDSRYYAQVTLGQSNLGKVAVGQKVLLRFDAYPYQEFGAVVGRLSYISRMPSDSGFLASISLPAGLVTNYGKQIQYRNGLRSQAMIITKDTRMLQRFYYAVVRGTGR